MFNLVPVFPAERAVDSVRPLHYFKTPQGRRTVPLRQCLKHPDGCLAVHPLASAQPSDFVMHTSSVLISKPWWNWGVTFQSLKFTTFFCASEALTAALPEWNSNEQAVFPCGRRVSSTE